MWLPLTGTQDLDCSGGPYLSVATRKVPLMDAPAPPPMTIPAISATVGLERDASWWLRVYSERKNLDAVAE